MTRIRWSVTSLVLSLVFLVCLAVPLIAQEAVEEPPPLLPEAVVRALAGEVSGTAAKRTVQQPGRGQRERRGGGRPGRRRRRDRRARLPGQGGAGEARPRLGPARRRLRPGRRQAWGGRPRLLRPEPADRLVGGGRDPRAL